MRIGLSAGAGQSSEMANRETTAASPQPATRSGSWDTGPTSETGRMKDSNRAVVAPASTELTTPMKSTAKATITIEVAATAVDWEARVPRQIKTKQTTPRDACARKRSASEPPKSTSSNMANDPKARK